jgi:cytochrome c biogenesis protein CcmG, thiol:disulfide interchange protein DsbE
MKKSSLFIAITIIIFCFFVLFKGLNTPNVYTPSVTFEKELEYFNAKTLIYNKETNSNELFSGKKIYLLNIWSSWCVPCREEHSTLMKLKNNPFIKIIGLNYKDDPINAKKFIEELGNPYSEIVIDKDGTISISLGAYGVPETFIIDDNKKILKKFIGQINDQSLNDIKLLLK